MRPLLPSLALLSVLAGTAKAVLSIPDDSFTYSQSFDSLANTGTANVWANDSTLPGWSLFRQPAPGTAMTTYNAGNGGSNAGAIYSFGTNSSTDRALGGTASGGAVFGSPAAGAIAAWITVGMTNDTGDTIDSITLAFDGEQWRDGGNPTPVAQTMVLQYGIGASFDTVATWTTPGGTFDFASPVFTTTAAAVDGNAAGLVTGLGGTLSGLGLAAGSSLWIRWVEVNDFGNDHGLGIDNFTISDVTTVVPEPTAALLGVVGLLGIFRHRRPRP